ncbi:MAG: methyltransferase [Rikenellaceae bacterium]
MFTFKEFVVHQDKTAMKVGTDGVMLGAWAAIDPSDDNILDIGTGTALIALMMAQRSGARVDAVEIDSSSAEQAQENVTASKWSNLIEVHHININDFDQNFRYDQIVCNPPYFSDSLLPPNSERAVARHTINLSFDELIAAVERLISREGKFSLILPVQELEAFEHCAKGKLFLWRKCYVRSRVGGDCKRILGEYRLSQPERVEIEDIAIRESETNEYTAEYKELTKDFYLKF